MNMPLVLLNRRRRGFTAFSPSTLFALAEPGVWYDPSDLTTLYQDPAGTTPVTTPGQTVGLMLDKSKGLALGAELLPNSFSSGTWTNVAAGVSLSSGVVTFSDVVPGSSGLLLNAGNGSPYTTSKAYSVTLTVADYVSGGLRVWTGSGYSAAFTANGTYTFWAVYPADTSLRVYAPTTGANTTLSATISVKELPGNHATQATLASRPTYGVDENGKGYLAFDGVDDGMVTAAIDFTATDKMSVFAGVRKLSNAASGILVELGASFSTTTGSFYVSAPETTGAGGNYGAASRGSATASVNQTAKSAVLLAPISSVLTATNDISGDLSAIRVNGVASGTNGTGDKGTGNFRNDALFIGRRNNTSAPFNGKGYGLIIVGKAASAGEIMNTETWVAGKTGISL